MLDESIIHSVSDDSGGQEYKIPNFGEGDVVISMNEYDKLQTTLERMRWDDSTLKNLKFQFFEFHSDDLKRLKAALELNSSLKNLIFYKTNIDNDAAQLIADGIRKCHGLAEVEFYQNGLTDDGASAIAKSLGRRITITSVTISKNYIGMKTLISLSESISSNPNITTVNLLQNNLGVKGGFYFASILEKNTGLTTLSLSYNKIGDLGASAIAGKIKLNTSLKRLILKGNEISHKGASVFGDALRENRHLETLDLSGNHLGDEGCYAIALALSEENAHLTGLDLSSNELSEKGGEMIMDQLNKNSTLVTLNIDTEYNELNTAMSTLRSRNKNFKEHHKELSSLGPFFYIQLRLDEGPVQDDVHFTYEWTQKAWESFTMGESGIMLLLQNLKLLHEATQKHSHDDGSSDVSKLQERLATNLCASLQTYSSLNHPVSLPDILGLMNKVFSSFRNEEVFKRLFLHKNSDGNTMLDKALRTETRRGRELVEFISLWVKKERNDERSSNDNDHKNLFVGRYNVNNWPKCPMYKSNVSRVYSAFDLEVSPLHKHHRVAIKIMNNIDDFNKELEERVGSRDNISDGEDLFSEDDNGKITNKTKFSEEYIMPLIRYHEEELCFVMPLGDRNLDEIIRNEAIAGVEIDEIRHILRSVAITLQYLHYEHKIIHGDIKPRNFVRHNGQFKMVDFNQATSFNTHFKAKRSTGYSAPEVAKDLFDFTKSRSLEWWIGQERKIMKKLIKLNRSNDADHEEIQLWENRLEDVRPHLKSPGFDSFETNIEPMASPSIDIWSFGVLSYYLMTGTQLFHCDQFDDIFSGDYNEQSKLLNWGGINSSNESRVCWDSSDPLIQMNAIDFLRRCLNPDPRLRFSNMIEVLNHGFLYTGSVNSINDQENDKFVTKCIESNGHTSPVDSVSYKQPRKDSTVYDDTCLSEITSVDLRAAKKKKKSFCTLFSSKKLECMNPFSK